ACAPNGPGEGPDRRRGAHPLYAPPAVTAADVEERLGAKLDGELSFTDSEGRQVRLADVFAGDKPVLLVLAYYHCPMLCGLVLRGAARGLLELGWTPEKEYRVVTVSFDPRDTAEAAREKRQSTLAALGRPLASPNEWPFLTGDEASIRALADTLGFRFAYDARVDAYAHPAAIFALTPDGRVSRYLYGVDFPARDLRLALTEAGEGRSGSIVDRVLLTCYRFDPASRRFGPYIAGFMRLGGGFILIVVTGLVGALAVAERRRRARASRAEVEP
ncbi:MAG: SCO family protein, partial [Byssovorax sp.]